MRLMGRLYRRKERKRKQWRGYRKDRYEKVRDLGSYVRKRDAAEDNMTDMDRSKSWDATETEMDGWEAR